MSADWVRPAAGGAEIDVLVVPRASKTELAGLHEGRLRVRVAAPPVEGQANQALVELFAKRLEVPKRAVTIESGQGGRRKRVRVAGLDPEAVRAALAVGGR